MLLLYYRFIDGIPFIISFFITFWHTREMQYHLLTKDGIALFYLANGPETIFWLLFGYLVYKIIDTIILIFIPDFHSEEFELYLLGK